MYTNEYARVKSHLPEAVNPRRVHCTFVPQANAKLLYPSEAKLFEKKDGEAVASISINCAVVHGMASSFFLSWEKAQVKGATAISANRGE